MLNAKGNCMPNIIILAIAAAIILAYLIDIGAKRFRIPAVIPLVFSGLVANYIQHRLGHNVDWVDGALPVLGTVGLILIVLEGALDLKLKREKAGLMGKALISAVLGFVLCSFLYTLMLQWAFALDTYAALALAIPFAVISSAVAIPSGRALAAEESEFVVYESSISDIIGVLVFFAWLSSKGDFVQFGYDLLSSSVLSVILCVVFSLGLLWMIAYIKGHVRFVPILACLFLLYAAGKELHLSPLILVLVFGLLLNNAQYLKHGKYLSRLIKPELDDSVADFKAIVAEIEFTIRSVFFIMLGLWTPLESLLDAKAWLCALAIITVLLVVRFAILKLLRLDTRHLVWLAPRGLITVLLSLSAIEVVNIGAFPPGAIMLTVLSTCMLVLLARPKPA